MSKMSELDAELREALEKLIEKYGFKLVEQALQNLKQ